MGNASRLKTWRTCSPCLLVCSARSDWLSKKSLKLTMGDNSVSVQSSPSACLIRNARGIGGERRAFLPPMETQPTKHGSGDQQIPPPLTRKSVQRDPQHPSRLGSQIGGKIWQLDGQA